MEPASPYLLALGVDQVGGYEEYKNTIEKKKKKCPSQTPQLPMSRRRWAEKEETRLKFSF